jgi:hypothetical protein
VSFHDPPRKGFSNHGAERDRTADLLNAIQALSQLSYSPKAIIPIASAIRSVNGLRAPARRLAVTGIARPELSKTVYARAGLTGLEPATSAVTVRHSNQAELQPQYPHGDSNPGRCAENAES